GVTWQRDASLSKGATYKFISIGAEDLSGTHTESDELTASDITIEDGIATPAVVGIRRFVSDEGLQDAIIDQETIFNDMAEKVRNRINSDVCALASSAATATNKTGQELTLDNFDAAKVAFLALEPGRARNVAILSHNQVAHLQKAIRQSGNGGLIQGAGLDVFSGRVNSSYQGNWAGFEIWTGPMPDDGASDTAGMMVGCDAPGDKSGLGLAVWWSPRPGIQRNEARVGWDFVVTARYGVCITADHMVHGIVTKKAF
ncbi:MAG TPA: hypothetical protein VIK91_11550, partial [Nannocystis sp.]